MRLGLQSQKLLAAEGRVEAAGPDDPQMTSRQPPDDPTDWFRTGLMGQESRRSRGRGRRGRGLLSLWLRWLLAFSPSLGLGGFDNLVSSFWLVALKGLIGPLGGTWSALRYCSRRRAGRR